MRRWLFVLVALAGCRQLFGIEPVTGDDAPRGDAGPRDGLPDGMHGVLADAPPGCYGAGTFTVCLSFTPQSPLMLGATLSTNTNSSDCVAVPPSWTANGQPDACFVIASVLAVPSGGTSVTGTRPLVLLATGDIVIDGVLDVASHVGGAVGPAANASTCSAGAAPASGGHGGGAGGSFTSSGGSGGNAGGAGGTAGTTTTSSTTLRGGCAGQHGDDIPGGGAGGNGGGALYAVSRDGTIRVNAAIDASGAGGGAGGTMGGGGGGGGSGGMIVLIAQHIDVTNATSVYADGGGGASGGSASSTGQSGSDPDGTTNGGVGASGGVVGGNGAHDSTSAQSGQASMFGSFGGGGGGGGAGLIAFSGTVIGTTRVSPTAQ